MSSEEIWKEYDYVFQLEQELNKTRWFGWLIFMAGFYHYWWFHRKTHALRDYMCELEKKLSISVFRIRTKRPRFHGVKIYYHWAVDAMAVAYTLMLGLIFLK